MAKQTIKQRKALRSAAAKKGWATRLARQRREIEATAASPLNWVWVNECDRAAFAAEPVCRHREMEPGDLGCILWSWETGEIRILFDIERALARRRSLFQRIWEWSA